MDGQIYDMAGESPEHGTICMNLSVTIGSQLKGTPRQAWSKDTKVQSGPTPRPGYTTKGLYSYPDLEIVCGAAQYLDEHRYVVVNPKVVIEVLSPSAQAFDCSEKLLRYQTWNPTLTDYLLVSQSSPLISHYVRQDDGGWSFYACQDLEQGLRIQSIDCTLRLADVYDRIAFPTEALDPAHE